MWNMLEIVGQAFILKHFSPIDVHIINKRAQFFIRVLGNHSQQKTKHIHR